MADPHQREIESVRQLTALSEHPLATSHGLQRHRYVLQSLRHLEARAYRPNRLRRQELSRGRRLLLLPGPQQRPCDHPSCDAPTLPLTWHTYGERQPERHQNRLHCANPALPRTVSCRAVRGMVVAEWRDRQDRLVRRGEWDSARNLLEGPHSAPHVLRYSRRRTSQSSLRLTLLDRIRSCSH